MASPRARLAGAKVGSPAAPVGARHEQSDPRWSRLDPGCVADLKGLFRDMWIINEDTRRIAVDAITQRILQPETAAGIRRFVEDARPPWQK